MSRINDGGSAFPTQELRDGNGNGTVEAGYGMSLRDWFAGQALAGIMAQSHAGPKDWVDMGHGWGEDCLNQLNCHDSVTALTLAAFSYQIADAMLAAREAKP